MMVFTWVDNNRQYFIVAIYYLKEILKIHQVDTDVNSEAQMVELDIPQPLAADMYYDICSVIDRHNRRRCNDIKLEKKLGTHDWDRRVNMIICDVSVVDSCTLATQSLEYEDTSC